MPIVFAVNAFQLKMLTKCSLNFDATKACRVIDARRLYCNGKTRIHLFDTPAQQRKLRLKWTIQCS